MASLLSLLARRSSKNFQTQHPRLSCEICGGISAPFDVVDFNKNCEEARGVFLVLAGIPIYYYRCESCGFCFSPEIARWSHEEFEERIYNRDYALVDPDYIEKRPQQNADALIAQFGRNNPSIKHLDYGGGDGLLSELLRKSGWQSTSYDPFVDRVSHVNQLGTFNLITAFEVFEHVPSPKKFMADLSALLAPDGIVLFTTLLSDGYIKPYQRLTWWYAAPRNGHISLFTKGSLLVLAESKGFQLGSFSEGYHCLWREVPRWAEHIIRFSHTQG